MGGGEKVKRRIAEMRKDERGLSPIFAVLILVAIAVIAGIIVYMFTSGYLATMMGGGSAGQEKVAIETVSVAYGAVAPFDPTGDVTAYCKSTGGGPMTITDAILKNAAGQNVEVLTLTTPEPLPADGELTDVLCGFTGTNLVVGNTYTLTLISQAGNQFVSPSFKV